MIRDLGLFITNINNKQGSKIASKSNNCTYKQFSSQQKVKVKHLKAL